jgi:hypothetical protein
VQPYRLPARHALQRSQSWWPQHHELSQPRAPSLSKACTGPLASCMASNHGLHCIVTVTALTLSLVPSVLVCSIVVVTLTIAMLCQYVRSVELRLYGCLQSRQLSCSGMLGSTKRCQQWRDAPQLPRLVSAARAVSKPALLILSFTYRQHSSIYLTGVHAELHRRQGPLTSEVLCVSPQNPMTDASRVWLIHMARGFAEIAGLALMAFVHASCVTAGE